MSSAESPQVIHDGNYGRQRPLESDAVLANSAQAVGEIGSTSPVDDQIDADIANLFKNTPNQLAPQAVYPEVVFKGSSPTLLANQVVAFNEFAARAEAQKHPNLKDVEMWTQRAHEALMALAKAEGRSPAEVREELEAGGHEFGFNNKIFQGINFASEPAPVAEEHTAQTSNAAKPVPLQSLPAVAAISSRPVNTTAQSLLNLHNLHTNAARHGLYGEDQAARDKNEADKALRAYAREIGLSGRELEQGVRNGLTHMEGFVNAPLSEEELAEDLALLSDKDLEAKMHNAGYKLHALRGENIDRDEVNAVQVLYDQIFDAYAARQGWSNRRKDREWNKFYAAWEKEMKSEDVSEEVKESRARVFASRLHDRILKVSHVIANPIDSVKDANARVDSWVEQKGYPRIVGRVAKDIGALAVGGVTGAVFYVGYKAIKHGAHVPVAAHTSPPNNDPALRMALSLHGNGGVTEAAKTLPSTGIHGIAANGSITVNVAPGQGFESVFHNLGLSNHDAAKAYQTLKPLLKGNGGVYRMGNEYGIVHPGNFTLNSQASDTLRAFLKANGLV